MRTIHKAIPVASRFGSLACAALLAACGSGGSNSPASSVATTPVPPIPPTADDAPTIAGTPTTSAVPGRPYRFKPDTTGGASATLAFSIENKPGWGSFNVSTGELTGTPGAGDVGSYGNIVIKVSNGASSAALPSFAIRVDLGSATLSWSAPTQNTDGSALVNLTGYHIYYGNTDASLTQSINVGSVDKLTYVVANLHQGTWYFAVTAYNSANVESKLSEVVSKTN